MHNYSLVLISTFLMAPASSYNFCTQIVTIFLYFLDNWDMYYFTFILFSVIYGVGYILITRTYKISMYSTCGVEWGTFQVLIFHVFLLEHL